MEKVVTDKTAGKTKMENTAYAVCKDTKMNRWCVVEIEFNYNTNSIGEMKTIYTDSDRSVCIEQFKIVVSNKELI